MIMDFITSTVRSTLYDPNPRVPDTVYRKFKHGFISPVYLFITELLVDFSRWIREDCMEFMIALVILLSSMYLVYRCLRPRVITGLYRLRGIERIQGEAAIPGSPLRDISAVPPCQVEIHKPGIFVSTFVGHGIRYEDILVAPVHVLLRAASNDEILLVTSRGKVLVGCNLVYSAKVSDVAYQLISPSVWAGLGVSRASVMKSSPVAVSCTISSRDVSATGFVKKAPQPYLLQFCGSTLPGFSGAAYVSNGAVYGIHSGVHTGTATNVGVSFEALSLEAKRLIRGEARQPAGTVLTSGSANNATGARRSVRIPEWEARDILNDDEDLFDQYLEDPSARNRSFDQWLRGESVQEMMNEFSNMDMSHLEGLIGVLQGQLAQRRMGTVNVAGQSDDGPVFEIVSTVDPLDELRARMTQLEVRVSSLENERKVVAGGGSTKGFPCKACSKEFSSAMGMRVHFATKHEVEGESATMHDDENQHVQTRPASFLGRTQSSKKKNLTSSKNISSSVRSSSPSTSGTKNQSSTRDMGLRLERALQEFARIISGLKEECQQ